MRARGRPAQLVAQRPTIGKWLKRARKPVAASTASRTPSSCSGAHGAVRPAALAHEVLALASGAHVAPGAVTEVDVLHEAEPLERLEVAIDGGEIGGRDLPKPSAICSALSGVVGRVERLEHHAARAREAQSAGAQRRDRLGQRLGLDARTRVGGRHRLQGSTRSLAIGAVYDRAR